MLIDPKWSRMVAIYTTAAFVKVVLLVSAFIGGRFLDDRFGSKPLFLILLILGAMGLGTWYVVVLTKKKL